MTILAMVIVATAFGSMARTGTPQPALHGENLSGAELNGDKLPGRINFDYTYPTLSDLDHAKKLRMNAIRLPILWERLQPQLEAALDPLEFARLRTAVTTANARNLWVIIDLHNYGHYRGQLVGSAAVSNHAFANLWGRVAHEFGGEPRVALGLMNEPTGISAEAWLASVQEALDAVRAAGFQNLVLVPGTAWDGAHDFVSGGYGTPNAAVLGQLIDPASNSAIEVHQYLDADNSGTHPDCPQATRATALLEPVTAWLRQSGKRGFLGEVGVSDRPDCLAGLDAMLHHIQDNHDVWLGWTYWAAGPWWSKDYMFSAEPNASAPTERPQVMVLQRYLPASNAAPASSHYSAPWP